jgi:RHS repeat-associated protein
LNEENGWRKEIATASMYNIWSWKGATKKLAHLACALAEHPRTVPYLGFTVLALGLAFVFSSVLRRTIRYSRRQRLAAILILLAFGFLTGTRVGPRTGETASNVLSDNTLKGPGLGTFFYHRNHVGSSSVVTDANGVEVSRMLYMPFGELAAAWSTGTDVVTGKYTGQEADEELGQPELGGIYYYNARYYDPSIGRFMSADSIVPGLGNAQAFNRYSYVMNNPISHIDPSGHGCGPDDLGPYCPGDNTGGLNFSFEYGWGASGSAKPGPWRDQAPVGTFGYHPADASVPGRAAGPAARAIPGDPVNDPNGTPRWDYYKDPPPESTEVDLTFQSQFFQQFHHFDFSGNYTLDPWWLEDNPCTGIWNCTVAPAHPQPFEPRGMTIDQWAHARFMVGMADQDYSKLNWWIVPEVGLGVALGVADLLTGVEGLIWENETAILQQHLKAAVEEFEANPGFTAAQADAIVKDPSAWKKFAGDRIHENFFERVLQDERLNHLGTTPRFGKGPDVFDPLGYAWWDVTTPAEWAEHVAQYGGRGIPLFYFLTKP